MMDRLSRLLRELEFPILLFPVLVTVLVAGGFILGFPCTLWHWWAAVVMMVVLMLCRRHGRVGIVATGVFVALLGVLWVVANILITVGVWDGLAYHQPAVRMLASGWNPVWQGTTEEITKVAGVPMESLNVWHVIAMPKGVWYFCAAAYKFTGAHFDLFFPLAPFMVCAMAYAVWDLFRRGGGMLAFFACLLSLALIMPSDVAYYGYALIVDYCVALAAIGLLATMMNVLRFGEWDVRRLVVFTFWMVVSKQVALLHCTVFWVAFVVALMAIKARRTGVWRRIFGVGAVTFALFCVTSVSPYVTSFVNFGHPLYPCYSGRDARFPARNLTSDFLERNEDAAAMGHGVSYVNAFVSSSAVRWYEERCQGRVGFSPDSVIWKQQEHSAGSPTTRAFRVVFCLSLAVLCALGGIPGISLSFSLLVGTLAIPTEMLGYLRYTPWVLWGAVYASMLLLSRLARWRTGRFLGWGLFGVFILWFVKESVWWCATNIENGYAVQTSMRLSPPKWVACVSYGGDRRIFREFFVGNVLMLVRNVPALANTTIASRQEFDKIERKKDLVPYYDVSFAVPRSYGLGRFAESWDPDFKDDTISHLRYFARVFFRTLPRSVLGVFKSE